MAEERAATEVRAVAEEFSAAGERVADGGRLGVAPAGLAPAGLAPAGLAPAAQRFPVEQPGAQPETTCLRSTLSWPVQTCAPRAAPFSPMARSRRSIRSRRAAVLVSADGEARRMSATSRVTLGSTESLISTRAWPTVSMARTRNGKVICRAVSASFSVAVPGSRTK